MLKSPEGVITIIPEQDEFVGLPGKLLRSLQGRVKRSWMHQRAYFCLPLVMGSQTGFVVEALYDFEATWDGGPTPDCVSVQSSASDEERALQIVSSHFGMGTVTVQNRWQYRTPPGVNLLVMPPPNYFVDGLGHLTAVVEADNLRRDFTFNLKLTRPGLTVKVNKGEPIGCVVPLPRRFIDRFKIDFAVPSPEVRAEQEAARLHGDERKSLNGSMDRRYLRGIDPYGTPFKDHQTRYR